MSLTTCAVVAQVYDQDGQPVSGATITATLNRYEVYEGYVVPDSVEVTTDTNGAATLDLWPNQLGSTESLYKIVISAPNGKTLKATAVVPDETTANLWQIATLPVYPGKTDGELILDAAVAAGATAVSEAAAAAASATAAAASATDAETAAGTIGTAVSDAESAATAAAASASAAASSATSAANSLSSIGTSATTATNAATAAAASATTASTKASEAATSATNAASSATTASGAATTATTKASDAATSATAAATSASSAASSASTATTKASQASTSASNAATSASNAATSATNAASSEASVAGNATAAASSATAAAASATTASGAATTATTKAGEAATSATSASTSAATATTKASEAATSATAAATAKTAAEAARDQTLAAFDSFDDRYLGVKASDPTVDNDGNALVGGALYFNSAPLNSGGGMKVYDGTGLVWLAAYASLSGALLGANNLSDLASASAARSNLGLGNVENKSSATIRGELTSGNVTTALGFTPYDASNPSSYITAAALSDYLTTSAAASGYQPLDGDLTAIAALAGTSGFLKKTGANTWALDTSTYLTSFTETDPVFAASDAAGITSTDISNWGTAYGWGNHASAGYLASATAATTYLALSGGTLTGSVGIGAAPASFGGGYRVLEIWGSSATDGGVLRSSTSDGSIVADLFTANAFGGAVIRTTTNHPILLRPNDVPALFLNPVASAVNYVRVDGAATGTGPAVYSGGPDTNIDLRLIAKGTGSLLLTASAIKGDFSNATASSRLAFQTSTANGNTIVTAKPNGIGTAGYFIAHNASDADNSSYIYMAALGSEAVIRTEKNGTGTLLPLGMYAAGARQAQVLATASAVNYLTLSGSTTGSYATLGVAGSDASIGLILQTKAGGSYALQDNNGARALLATPVTDSVNYLQVVSAVTGAAPYLTATGTDTDIALVLSSKGTGNVLLRANSATALAAWNPSSAVNAVIINGNTTGYGPGISATGSDTNINLNISGKGTGSVVFGSPTTAKAHKETKVAAGANDFDLATANYFSKTISTTTTLTVSNVPATGTAASFILDLTNGGAGTITWWSGMKWAGGTAPTLTSSGRDVLGFFTHDGGTTWTGLVLGKDVK